MALENTTTVVADPTPAPPSDEAKLWSELMAENDALGADDGEAAPIQEPKEGELEVKEPDKEAKPEPTAAELKAQVDNLNKALRADRAEKQLLAQRLSNYDDFIKQIRENRGQKQEPERKEPEQPKIPSIDEDPVGHFQAQVTMLQQQIERLTQGTQQTHQQLQAQTEEQRFWGDVERSEVAERAASPTFTVTVEGKPTQVSDYDLACQHLESMRVAELETMLPDESPHAIAYAQKLGAPSVAAVRAYMLNQDRIAVARHAMAINMSPAKLYYSLAKQRGYQPPTQAAAQQQRGKQQIAAQKAGAKAAVTISGGSGGGSKEMNSLSDLTDLYAEDPDEFDKQWEKMRAAGRLG